MNGPRLDGEQELELLKAGDPSAQGRFILTHRERLVAIGYRILKDRARAEDLAEDVVIDFLFQAVANLRRSETITAYLNLMAARRALRVRDLQRRMEPVALDRVEASTTSPEASAERSDVAARLEHCLSELTPKARAVIKLRFGEDRTQEHIGAMLGASKQYIGKLIQQSLAKLRTCLALQGLTVPGGDE